jgi:hypothetical protein
VAARFADGAWTEPSSTLSALASATGSVTVSASATAAGGLGSEATQRRYVASLTRTEYGRAEVSVSTREPSASETM